MSTTVIARAEPASAQYRRVRQSLNTIDGAPASAPGDQHGDSQEQSFDLLDARRVAASGENADDSSESENQGDAATGRGRKRAYGLPRRASPEEAAVSLLRGEG